MKKIDIHAHIVQYPDWTPKRIHSDNGRILSVEEQIALYDEMGIDMGVLLPIASPEAQFHAMPNTEAIVAAQKYPDRFVWFCNVDPRADSHNAKSDLDYLVNFYKDLGARGLGELTTNLPADDPMMDNLFGACERAKMPVTIHIAPKVGDFYGIVDDIGLPRIAKMLKKHPDLVILGHSQAFWAEIADNIDEVNRCGYPDGKVKEGNLQKLLREYHNLHCDLSAGSGGKALMRDPEHAARFIEEFADRIHYGMDVCGQNHSFHVGFAKFLEDMHANKMITTENYEKIMYKNTAKLLNINI